MKKLSKEHKKGKIMSVLLIAIFVMSMGTFCFANGTPGGYDISQYAYYGEYNNVSAFIQKDTYSSMYAHCDSSSDEFKISAVGSTAGTGYQDDYMDASRGHSYLLSGGQTADDIINFVRENGCCNAGIKGEYLGDSAFVANGWFLADK